MFFPWDTIGKCLYYVYVGCLPFVFFVCGFETRDVRGRSVQGLCGCYLGYVVDFGIVGGRGGGGGGGDGMCCVGSGGWYVFGGKMVVACKIHFSIFQIWYDIYLGIFNGEYAYVGAILDLEQVMISKKVFEGISQYWLFVVG